MKRMSKQRRLKSRIRKAIKNLKAANQAKRPETKTQQFKSKKTKVMGSRTF
jgi:hypothetical protein